jgi:hypothetical protein
MKVLKLVPLRVTVARVITLADRTRRVIGRCAQKTFEWLTHVEMVSANPGNGQDNLQASERDRLSTGDVERVAEAVSKKLSKYKPVAKGVWIFVGILCGVAIGTGVWGFTQRPPQNATFRGTLATGTVLTVTANPAVRHHVQGSVTYLKLAGHDESISLRLQMPSKEQTVLADALKPYVQPGVPTTVLGTLELFFNQPTEIVITSDNTEQVSITKLSDEAGAATMQLTALAVNRDINTKFSPSLQVFVKPPQREGASFSVKVSDIDLERQFSLQPGSVNATAIVLMDVSTHPLDRRTGEIAVFSIPAGQPSMWASLSEVPDKIGDARTLGEQQLDIADTPDGVLAMGTVVHKLAAGEHLQISVDNHQSVQIRANRIVFDALGDANVTRAVRNNVANLLPVRFTLWADWAQQLWRWGAITTGAGALIALMRRFNLWPS